MTLTETRVKRPHITPVGCRYVCNLREWSFRLGLHIVGPAGVGPTPKAAYDYWKAEMMRYAPHGIWVYFAGDKQSPYWRD